MVLTDWWYYTGSVTKAITIIGIIAIALLAIVLASPHVKPLQSVDKALGLVQVQTIYVPVNHTVYVNQTVVKYVYVNKTVPVYINRTVYVYVPSNASFGIPILNNTGTCGLYSLVLPNGTIWTLGYWIPTQLEWNLFLQNGTIIGWEKFPAPPQYGEELYWETTVYAILPGLGTANLEGVQFITAIPNKPQPNWINMIYMGDFMGTGPIMYPKSYWGVDNGTAVLLNTWSLYAPFYGLPRNYTTIVLPVNRTYTVIIAFMSKTLAPDLAILCNWTIMGGPVNPQVALRLPAPMGRELASETAYVIYGNYSYPSYGITWDGGLGHDLSATKYY